MYMIMSINMLRPAPKQSNECLNLEPKLRPYKFLYSKRHPLTCAIKILKELINPGFAPKLPLLPNHLTLTLAHRVTLREIKVQPYGYISIQHQVF